MELLGRPTFPFFWILTSYDIAILALNLNTSSELRKSNTTATSESLNQRIIWGLDWDGWDFIWLLFPVLFGTYGDLPCRVNCSLDRFGRPLQNVVGEHHIMLLSHGLYHVGDVLLDGWRQRLATLRWGSFPTQLLSWAPFTFSRHVLSWRMTPFSFIAVCIGFSARR